MITQNPLSKDRTGDSDHCQCLLHPHPTLVTLTMAVYRRCLLYGVVPLRELSRVVLLRPLPWICCLVGTLAAIRPRLAPRFHHITDEVGDEEFTPAQRRGRGRDVLEMNLKTRRLVVTFGKRSVFVLVSDSVGGMC
jgi:hypothetical protein